MFDVSVRSNHERCDNCVAIDRHRGRAAVPWDPGAIFLPDIDTDRLHRTRYITDGNLASATMVIVYRRKSHALRDNIGYTYVNQYLYDIWNIHFTCIVKITTCAELVLQDRLFILNVRATVVSFSNGCDMGVVISYSDKHYESERDRTTANKYF